MTKDEALRLALEALENWREFDPENFGEVDKKAIAAIKAALVNEALERKAENARELGLDYEPWLPVSIGVDMTKEGAHVVGIYTLNNDTSHLFYNKFYPAPQHTWVGLTNENLANCSTDEAQWALYWEKLLKEKNT